MTEADTVLSAARSVLVVDWPSRDVPETLARAGFVVSVHGGPGPNDYATYECAEGDTDAVVVRQTGTAPERVDLVYSHRPLSEMRQIVATAVALGARAIWVQSGLTGPGVPDPAGCWVADDESRSARKIVEAAGLIYIEEPYIGDAVRRGTGSHPPPAGAA